MLQTILCLYTGIQIFCILWAGWIKIEGAESGLIRASLRTDSQTIDCIGTVLAKPGCWSFLKGGFLLDSPSNLSLLYFQVKFLNLTIFKLIAKK